MTGVKAHQDLFYSHAGCWCAVKELIDISQSSGRRRKHSFHCPRGHRFFSCARQYSTTWEPREAKTHPLLLVLCNHNCNLSYAPGLPWLTYLPAILFLLPVTSYLPFSVIVRRCQGFRFPTETGEQGCFLLAFSLGLMVLFPVGWPSSVSILAVKATKFTGWKPLMLASITGPLFPRWVFQPWASVHQCSCFSCTTPCEENFACEENLEAWGQDLFGCTSIPNVSWWPALGNPLSSVVALHPSAETLRLTVSGERLCPNLDTGLLSVGSQRCLRGKL